MPKDSKFEVFRGHGNIKDAWFFHLKAPNGEIIDQSEAYTSKQAALDTIKAIKRNAPGAKVVVLDK